MKKILFLVTAMVSMSTAASALSIVNTKHDLSTTSTATFTAPLTKSATTNQICIFCHTPHNPTQNVPLWNRTNPAAAGWTMYESPTLSATATAKLATGTFDADSISLFCMSCHDGVTTMGAFSNRAGLPADATGVIPVASKAMIGTILSNDHPVGFNYATAAGEDAGLKAIATANTTLAGTGSAFFGTTGEMIECASCHKVHDNAAAPFLRISNASSALCLACHDK